MYKLIDEKRRNVARSFAHKSAESSLKCLVPQQMIAEIDQQLPVFARIWIGDGLYVRRSDRPARIGHQGGMQRALDRASLQRRQQFRPGEVQFQELVGHVQASILVPIEQMVAAGNPEIVHLRSRSTIAIRSTCSPGCSGSPSTSKKEKARAGLGPLRGRNVRKDSFTAPSSNVRCTATSMSCGCEHSDSAKATSSSAAASASSTVGAPNLATNCLASVSTTSRRSPSFAATICTSVDQPSVDTPRNPLRNADRALPSSDAESRFQNAKAPDTAHSPGSAAFSNTKVSEASSRIVRRSFMTAVLWSWHRTRPADRGAAEAFVSLPQPCPFCGSADRHSHRCHDARFVRAANVEDSSSPQRGSRSPARHP